MIKPWKDWNDHSITVYTRSVSRTNWSKGIPKNVVREIKVRPCKDSLDNAIWENICSYGDLSIRYHHSHLYYSREEAMFIILQEKATGRGEFGYFGLNYFQKAGFWPRSLKMLLYGDDIYQFHYDSRGDISKR